MESQGTPNSASYPGSDFSVMLTHYILNIIIKEFMQQRGCGDECD
jgi:hypothetical protein